MNKLDYINKRIEQWLKGKDFEITWRETLDLLAFGVTPHLDVVEPRCFESSLLLR